MENRSNAIKGNREQRIINILQLNASFIDNLGLMHGKMGIAIYFFHLSRKTQNQLYENYAGELIDEIYEEITITTPLDFENGLAGIGWGIEYLAQNGFIEADTDEVLEDFDNRLQSSINQFEGISLLNGLIGLGAYYLKRIQNPASSEDKKTTAINKHMLIHLIDEMELHVENEGAINLIKGTETFSLTWGYPILLVFLAEVSQLNLFNFKVERMLKQLTNLLFHTKNLPMQQSKRLLLVLALEKLKNLKIEPLLEGSIDKLIQNLSVGIEREGILKELAPNSTFLQSGTSGIAWIYSQLFQFTGEKHYQIESLYWNTRSFDYDETNQGYAGFKIANENDSLAFGLLEGLSGINFSKL